MAPPTSSPSPEPNASARVAHQLADTLLLHRVPTGLRSFATQPDEVCQRLPGNKPYPRPALWPAAGWAYTTIALFSTLLTAALVASTDVTNASMLEATEAAVTDSENRNLNLPTSHASPPKTPAGSSYLVVTGTLDRQLSGPLLLDTGASFCLISPATALSLGHDPLAGTPVTVSTANGDTTGRLVNLRSVAIDSVEVTEVPTVVLSTVQPPLLGVVGLSFLNHFRYTIDSRNGMFRIHRD